MGVYMKDVRFMNPSMNKNLFLLSIESVGCAALAASAQEAGRTDHTDGLGEDRGDGSSRDAREGGPAQTNTRHQQTTWRKQERLFFLDNCE